MYGSFQRSAGMIPRYASAASLMMSYTASRSFSLHWRIEEDIIDGTVAVTIGEGGASILEDRSRVYSSERLVLTASDEDPARASLDTVVVYRWTGPGFDVDIRSCGGIVSDEAAFAVRLDLDVRLDGEPFFAREWSERVPRRLV